MRLGADPRTVVTTTPRPAKLIRDLVRDPTCVVTRGSSYENRANLAGAFLHPRAFLTEKVRDRCDASLKIQVRMRLSAGGRWIRTSGSGASGEADAFQPVKDRPR